MKSYLQSSLILLSGIILILLSGCGRENPTQSSEPTGKDLAAIKERVELIGEALGMIHGKESSEESQSSQGPLNRTSSPAFSSVKQDAAAYGIKDWPADSEGWYTLITWLSEGVVEVDVKVRYKDQEGNILTWDSEKEYGQAFADGKLAHDPNVIEEIKERKVFASGKIIEYHETTQGYRYRGRYSALRTTRKGTASIPEDSDKRGLQDISIRANQGRGT